LNIQGSLGRGTLALVFGENEAHQNFVAGFNGAADVAVDLHEVILAFRPRRGKEENKAYACRYSMSNESHDWAIVQPCNKASLLIPG
jgi:hypothetical protein